MIPEEPERVHIQKCRIASISQRLIDKFEDDDYDKYVDYASDDDDENEGEGGGESRIPNNESNYESVDASKSSIDIEEDPENALEKGESDDKHNSINSANGLKRADKGFYQRNLTSKNSGWWNSMSRSFWFSSGRPVSPNRKSLTFRKKKAYRTRVHHAVSDAIHLSPLAVFDYPFSEDIKNWTPPLTRDGVGRESDLDILDLDI